MLVLDRDTKARGGWGGWSQWGAGAELGGPCPVSNFCRRRLPPPPLLTDGRPAFRAQDIVAPLLHVSELRKHGVTLHLLLDSERQPIPDVPAVYFVRPTDATVQVGARRARGVPGPATASHAVLLLSYVRLHPWPSSSLTCRAASPMPLQRVADDTLRGLYDSFHLNFSTHLPRPLMERLASGACVGGGCFKCHAAGWLACGLQGWRARRNGQRVRRVWCQPAHARAPPPGCRRGGRRLSRPHRQAVRPALTVFRAGGGAVHAGAPRHLLAAQRPGGAGHGDRGRGGRCGGGPVLRVGHAGGGAHHPLPARRRRGARGCAAGRAAARRAALPCQPVLRGGGPRGLGRLAAAPAALPL